MTRFAKPAILNLLLAVLPLSACVSSGLRASASAEPAGLSKERIAAIVASPDRSAADRKADMQRKPELMLAFLGVGPGMQILDLSAGGGYTSELLARAVGASGRVYGQSAPRSAPRPTPKPEGAAPTTLRPSSPQALAERAKNPLAASIVPLVRPFEEPLPPELPPGTLDIVTLMFNYHDLGHMGVDRARLNRAVFAGLKSGGVYVLADHAGRPGTGISEATSLHRIEEAFLRQEVESAGFKLAGEGSFLRNPADPRDKNIPDPLQPKDEFVLKFVKP